MSCFSWNYHGSIVRELREFAKRFALTALHVLQTQIHKARVESLKSTLGYDNSFAISSAGRSGRLGVFWNNNIRVQILPYSQYHIDTIVTENRKEPWRLTCVYREAQTTECHKTWDTLKFIKAASHLPWVCIGDFNEVLQRNEHMGVCKNAAVHELQAFVKRLMCAVCMNLVMRGGSGRSRRKLQGESFVMSGLIEHWLQPTGTGAFHWHG